VVFDEQTARTLTAWQQRQRFERRSWGSAYAASGRVFTYEDGRALRPGHVSERFGRLTRRYAAIRRRCYAEGFTPERAARRHRTPPEAAIALTVPLPPVRFRDPRHGTARHGTATMLRAAKVEIKVISEILGHASTSFTGEAYTVVAEELAEQAAQAIASFIPRRSRMTRA
jgi:integrase